MKPMLYASALTGTIWLATRYTDHGDNHFTAHTKYDVTSQVIKIMHQIQDPSWGFEYNPKAPESPVLAHQEGASE